MPNIIINDKPFSAKQNQTILEVALENNLYIPNLCYHPQLKSVGACRLCLVEVDGRGIVTACNTPIEEGMKIKLDTPNIESMRRESILLLLVNYRGDCLTSAKDAQNKLQEIAAFAKITSKDLKPFIKKTDWLSVDDSNPFFDYDSNKCVLCGICVRTCDELENINAIDLVNRGYQTVIAPFAKKPWIDSRCESCGECVIRCPSRALTFKTQEEPEREVLTTCPYCGCGCTLYLGTKGNCIVSSRGAKDGPANHGFLCVKGRFGYEFVNSPERLIKPLIKKDKKFVESTWDEALNLIVKKLSHTKPNEFAMLSSAKFTNEDNYVLQKFTRAVMHTNNIDHCARLCHAPTVAGLAQSFGSGAMTNSNDDIGEAQCIFAIGTNTTEAHPIIALQVKKAAKNGTKLIAANPKRINLCRHATLFLQQKPGTDVPLILAMIKVILDEKLYDEEFIKIRTEDFEILKDSLKDFDLDEASKITGVKKEKIIEAAQLYATNKPGTILYAMGITQHICGTDNVLAISNLALLTGNIGKPGSGVNPLRGQNNVQGACDMGALPNVYPGYQKVTDEKVQAKFEKAWRTKLDNQAGLTHTEMFDALEKGKIKVFYIAGENPVLSEANANHTKHCLEKAPFVVVQDIFMTETAEYADVILPATTFAEKEGTFTNSERRIQRVRKVIKNVGDSRNDWEIICNIAKRMKQKGFDFKSSKEIMDEITSITPIYGGIDYARIEEKGLQWPCRDKNDPGTSYLYKEQFSRPNGKAKFIPLKFTPPAEWPDKEFPFLLTTDRSLFHYHTGTMTRKVKGLNVLHKNEWIVIHPVDAKKLNIKENDWVEVKSRRGKIKVQTKIIDIIAPGVVSMTFHFHEAPTNELTNNAIDPVAKIPETKVCAVKIKKVKFQEK